MNRHPANDRPPIAPEPLVPRALLAVVAVVALGLAVILRLTVDVPLDALIEGLAFTVAGLAAWARRPTNRTGKLMVGYGFLIWSIHLQRTEVPLLWTMAGILFPIAVFGVLLYLILSYPAGRLMTVADRVLFSLAIGNVVFQISILFFLDPAFVCPPCPGGLNLLLLNPNAELVTAMAKANPWWLSAVMLPMIGLLVARWARATAPGRRVIAPMLIPAVVFLLANRVHGLGQALTGSPLEAPPAWHAWLRGIEQVAVTILPLAFLVGLLRSRLRHARVSRLVVELGELPPPDQLEEALSRALGDPSLKVGVWDEAVLAYVRGSGEVLAAPRDSDGHVGTVLEREDRPLALVVHDEALLDEPGLVDAMAAATRMAIENERLQAELRAQLEEVQASRQRILAAQDEERRRIERDLHDGAQQRLLRSSMAINVAASSIPPVSDPALRTSLQVAAEELHEALQELRDLARGIHPAVLAQRGLAAAVRSLAETAAVPVVVDDVVEGRFPSEVETAAYFVASEALTNVAKHASATVARIRVQRSGASLQIEVMDDGIGGAAVEPGGGLHGLVDRLQALGGTLELESVRGEGTTLRGTIPVDPALAPDTALTPEPDVTL